MTHMGDRRMLLLDPSKRDTVFSMDVERGKVVEEWVRMETP